MTDTPKPPFEFANRIIRQMIDHVWGGDIIIEPNDYLTMRAVFRRCGGEWEKILGSDLVHLELLKTVVNSWGALPDHKKKPEEER